MWPTCRTLPDAFTAAASSSTSSTETPTGFSHSTCLPAASARIDAVDMEGVRGRDDHRVELGIGEHRVIVEIGLRPAGRWPPCARPDRRPRRRWRGARHCGPSGRIRNARTARSGRSRARLPSACAPAWQSPIVFCQLFVHCLNKLYRLMSSQGIFGDDQSELHPQHERASHPDACCAARAACRAPRSRGACR